MIFIVTLTYIMGVSSINIAFPEVVNKLNISVNDIGMLISVFSLPDIILTPVLEQWGRWCRTKIIIPSLILFGIARSVFFLEIIPYF